MTWARARGDAIDLDVQVVPRASRSRVAGVTADRLKIQLSAPPVDGEANRALVELIAELLDVRRANVSIVSGETSRKKTVRVSGATLEAVEALAAT